MWLLKRTPEVMPASTGSYSPGPGISFARWIVHSMSDFGLDSFSRPPGGSRSWPVSYWPGPGSCAALYICHSTSVFALDMLNRPPLTLNWSRTWYVSGPSGRRRYVSGVAEPFGPRCLRRCLQPLQEARSRLSVTEDMEPREDEEPREAPREEGRVFPPGVRARRRRDDPEDTEEVRGRSSGVSSAAEARERRRRM